MARGVKAEPVLAADETRQVADEGPVRESGRPWVARGAAGVQISTAGSSARVATRAKAVAELGQRVAPSPQSASAKTASGTPTPSTVRRAGASACVPGTQVVQGGRASAMASTASLSCRRNSSASGPNSSDKGMATAHLQNGHVGHGSFKTLGMTMATRSPRPTPCANNALARRRLACSCSWA